MDLWFRLTDTVWMSRPQMEQIRSVERSTVIDINGGQPNKYKVLVKFNSKCEEGREYLIDYYSNSFAADIAIQKLLGDIETFLNQRDTNRT